MLAAIIIIIITFSIIYFKCQHEAGSRSRGVISSLDMTESIDQKVNLSDWSWESILLYRMSL